MNNPAPIGHNGPPEPIDQITAEFEDQREEAANWLDGEPVENNDQLKAVDELRKAMREWRLTLERGQKEATAPLYAIYKAELERWKPTIEDAKRIEAGLVACAEPYKLRLAEEKRAAEKAAWEAANKAKREAEEKARAATASDLEAQREAAAAQQAAIDAEKAAQAARKDKPKGLRTVKETVVVDPQALARYLWQHDREAMDAFMLERARKLALDIPTVVEIRTRQEAF